MQVTLTNRERGFSNCFWPVVSYFEFRRPRTAVSFGIPIAGVAGTAKQPSSPQSKLFRDNHTFDKEISTN
jgi:hypothetical protein